MNDPANTSPESAVGALVLILLGEESATLTRLPVLDAEDAAAVIGLAPSTVRQRIRAGVIPSTEGRVSLDAVLAYSRERLAESHVPHVMRRTQVDDPREYRKDTLRRIQARAHEAQRSAMGILLWRLLRTPSLWPDQAARD